MSEATSRPRCVDDLIVLERGGDLPEFLLFWGHRPPRSGGVGKGCLSQWWPAGFTVDGVRYPTAEHFMMAAKARLFGATGIAERIVAAPHPDAAKRLGRQVPGFDEAAWERERFAVVVRANLAKFDQHPDLRGYLLGTGGRVLVEASPLDRVWGIGLAAADERAGRPSAWRGLNLLGFALMRVRETLAERAAGAPS